MKMFLEKMEAQEKAIRAIAKNDATGDGGGKKTGGGGYKRRNNTSKYCWTHGTCAHDSTECHNKKQGHVDTATFSNKCEGSTKFCNPQK